MSEAYNIGEPTSDVPAIVGEIEAGRAAKVRREITKLIKATNSSEFDIAFLLHEVKSNHYYSPDFESFSKFAKRRRRAIPNCCGARSRTLSAMQSGIRRMAEGCR